MISTPMASHRPDSRHIRNAASAIDESGTRSPVISASPSCRHPQQSVFYTECEPPQEALITAPRSPVQRALDAAEGCNPRDCSENIKRRCTQRLAVGAADQARMIPPASDAPEALITAYHQRMRRAPPARSKHNRSAFPSSLGSTAHHLCPSEALITATCTGDSGKERASNVDGEDDDVGLGRRCTQHLNGQPPSQS